MKIKEVLDLLTLLSALESWSFSTGKMLPDYLYNKLSHSTDLLTKVLLENVEDD